MDIMDAIKERHAVRSFSDRKIEGDTLEKLKEIIAGCNKDGGLDMKLVTDEPVAFSGRMARYGNFKGVKNYVAVIGPKGGNAAERCGYYGEKVVLQAQMLGLNTCWVGLTYSKVDNAFRIAPEEKLYAVIAAGYGVENGKSHKVKTVEEVSECDCEMPDWFAKGVDAALLAPTAMNQQKFKFILKDGKVSLKKGFGFFTDVDEGIVKCHFEIGSGKTLEG